MSTLTETLPAKASPKPPAKRGPNRKLIRVLSQPLVLEESGPPDGLLNLLSVCSAFVAAFVVWAAITPMKETATTSGQIIPVGSVNVVQHLEGGIIREILVEEGQIVEPGEVLMRLQSAAAQAELDQLRAKESTLAIKAERLRSFVLGFEPDFSAGSNFPDLVRDEETILQMQKGARDSRLAVLLSRIEQREAEIAALDEQRKSLNAQIAITREQLEMRRKLAAKKLIPKIDLLDNERAMSDSMGQLNAVIADITRAKGSLSEARAAVLELQATLGSDAVAEMGEISGELAQVREARIKLEDRTRRLEIEAPVRGIVKGLVTQTIGSVVPPGETIMEIVPFDDTLVAEVRILPKDVGHLSVGQPAQVKVTTYDVARYGVVEGELKQISASTFRDEEGEPYFKGIIELSQSYVGTLPDQNPILPGMVVDADVSTGSKSLFRYLLKPVYRSLDGAFSER